MIAHEIRKEITGFEVHIWNGFQMKYIGTRKTKKEAMELLRKADRLPYEKLIEMR